MRRVEGTGPRDTDEGVWVARNADGSAAPLFRTEVEALRHAVSLGMSEVVFVPYGEDAIYYAPPRST